MQGNVLGQMYARAQHRCLQWTPMDSPRSMLADLEKARRWFVERGDRQGGFVSHRLGDFVNIVDQQLMNNSMANLHFVTWTAWRAKPARFQTNPPSLTSRVGTSLLTSL